MYKGIHVVKALLCYFVMEHIRRNLLAETSKCRNGPKLSYVENSNFLWPAPPFSASQFMLSNNCYCAEIIEMLHTAGFLSSKLNQAGGKLKQKNIKEWGISSWILLCLFKYEIATCINKISKTESIIKKLAIDWFIYIPGTTKSS